jgi:hypothetical protein
VRIDPMKREPNDAEWHLDDPRTRKWIVQCAACGTQGYRAGAPEKFFGRDHLVRHFEAIDLDEHGRCASCREASADAG